MGFVGFMGFMYKTRATEQADYKMHLSSLMKVHAEQVHWADCWNSPCAAAAEPLASLSISAHFLVETGARAVWALTTADCMKGPAETVSWKEVLAEKAFPFFATSCAFEARLCESAVSTPEEDKVASASASNNSNKK